ncbi:UNVERIFIED_CONTAM: hypothetical protein Sradi_5709700 [Sesamum radiatum]|uniref:Reverse transcriptase zinc-binding domain-containing protein n=1 Tax=Sesamum radiatum TaxID=300843 RepID=A0AAW2L3D2_SESRA
MRTRELLAAGIRWSVGNRESISVVGVPWLPRPATFQVIFPPSSIPGTTKVAVLLNEGGWNESLVRKKFRSIDSECILSIPIPSERRPDELIWHSSRQGQFSVRSAYSLSCSLGPKATTSHNLQNWNFVWGICLAPKIRLFIWKVCNRAVSTLRNLRQRGVRLAGGCALCDSSKGGGHYAYSCRVPFCSFGLGVLGVAWRLVDTYSKDAEEWLRSIHHRVEVDDYEMVTVICWCLWYNRNLRVFEGIAMEAVEVIDMARR